MKEHVIQFLAKYVNLSEEEARLIVDDMAMKSYKKGEIILNKGAISKYCYFVLKGCIRNYYILDGVENITEFYTEGQPITPVSYTTGEPSEYFIDCVEDTIVSLGSPEGTAELFQRIPRLKEIGLRINSEMLAEKQVSFDVFRNLQPEQRYEKLLETRPELFNRVPQYMLASYLGVKPESLSRIRKRLHQQRLS